MAGAGLAIVTTNVAFPVPPALVAPNVKFVVAAAVGVPEITPVAVLMASPAGSGDALKLVGLFVAVQPPTITSALTASGTVGVALSYTITAPAINSILTASGTVGTSFNYQITATNSPTSFNASGLPAGLTINTSTGVISGTPTTSGTTNITLSATNAAGTGTATLALTIQNVTAPVITSSLTASGSVGASFSYQITASNSPTSFNATSLPGGLSVNTSTGVISGTPTTTATTNVPISATNAGGTGSATLVVTITNLAPGFYVATNGSDSNAGTLAAPFATLGKCQTAMQGSGTNKTCYIRAGSYVPAGLSACNSRGNCAIALSSPNDNGETWSYYPPDGVDSADITGGSTASGNGLWGIIYTGNAAHVTINGLSLHNFDFAAIMSTGGDPTFLTITNNVIFNGLGLVGDATLTGAQSASGFMCYDCTNLTVTHNVVHDIASFGITNDYSAGSISNYLVDSNILYNICTGIRDCGAIYSQDLSSASTNLKITNNYVRDGAVFDTAGWGAGVYLDDCTNNYVVKGNVLTGENGGNNIVIQGGSNNVFSDNITDLSTFGNPILRFQSSSCAAPTGNSFENNIIVSGAGIGGYNGVTGNVTVTANAYWDYATGTLNSTGDANPTVENPEFSCLGYNVTSGSPVFNAPVNFVAAAGGWGPPGYTIPQTGTNPSTTIGCAIASNSFLSSLGVNTHMGQGDAESPHEARFIYTGIRNARDYAAQYAEYVTLHNNTVVTGYPGVKFDLLAGAPSAIVSEATPLDAVGAYLSAEGPNEPNNFPITYLGNPGGGSGTWVPVAQFQRDLYTAVNGSSLSSKLVFNTSEVGAETDNVGLQCLVLNSTCPGASSVTLMPANTAFYSHANDHNYVQGNGACFTPAPTQAWGAEDPTLAGGCWDGLRGSNISTWAYGYAGYTATQALTLPRVTTETGWDSSSAGSTQDYQGKVVVNTYLDAYKRGWAYTFVYEMLDYTGQSVTYGLYTAANVPKLSATYIHNLTTVLQDTTNFMPTQLNYSIASEPATVHDMLLQKANGNFYLVIWDEQTTTATTDNITVTLGAPATVTEYDTTVGTSPVNTFTNTTSIPLTLSDHAIILEIP